MKSKFEIKTVDGSNIDESGFFCYMSKRKEPGYKQKREWLEARFAEGMKIKILHENGGRDVAFIEYIPGEYAWRAVNAPGYMVIHCLWVVGKGKGKGYGNLLIKECLDDARAQKCAALPWSRAIASGWQGRISSRKTDSRKWIRRRRRSN